jgi:hypothetical protein
MANLPDVATPGFPDVYELAVDDPVAGGPDGVDNLPHKQLAERTLYLKQRADSTASAVSAVDARVETLEASSVGSVGRAVPLAWEYGDEGYDFELFSQGFEWRDMAPVTVVQTVAGDESIDVSDTSELQIGGTYAIYSGTGVAYPVTVSAILSPVRFRASEVLSVSLNGATLARTSWDVRAGYAVAKNGGVFYSRPVQSLRYYGDGRVVIRRDDSDGTLGLQYRVAGTGGAWQDATLLGTVARAQNSRDEEYRVVGGSLVEFRLEMANGPSALDMTVFHMVAFPGDTAGRAWDVAQPINLSPADGATGLNDTVPLVGSAYRSLYGIAQDKQEFRVATEAEMVNVVYSSLLGIASNTHTIPAGNLAVDTVYFWQVRYQDLDGTWSPWSEPTAFATGSVFQYVQQPTNTAPAAGTTSASVVPTVQASAFTVIGGTDTHAASQWQVATDSAFTAIVLDTGETSSSKTSHAVPAGILQDQTAYFFRVRYKGAALGWSPYSSPTVFSTQAVPAAPTNTAPANAATEVAVAPTLQTSAFFIPGVGDTHAKSQFQVATDSGFGTIVYDSGESADLTSHVASSGLVALTTYHWRARHKGLVTGWGPWSAPTSFTTRLPAGSTAYATSGTFTWTAPAGVTSVTVKVIGGGGAGGNDEGGGPSPGGGGGGGGALGAYTVIPGSSYTVTVGTGGAPSGNRNGASSSFGSFLSATGGSAGGSDPDRNGGSGGVGAGGSILNGTGGAGGMGDSGNQSGDATDGGNAIGIGGGGGGGWMRGSGAGALNDGAGQGGGGGNGPGGVGRVTITWGG